jgi:transcriptional regulator
MYVPPAFREDRPEVLRALIRTHPLATLVTVGADGLTANLTPFILVETPEGDVLRAHMARANDQFESLRTGAEALVVFQGPQTYITPAWYATKAEHGKVVPTWNYAMVQAWGTPQVIDDADWVLAQVTALTTAQESRRAEPWAVTDAPETYVAAQLRGIVGLEIPIRRIEGKWKVSQNQPEANRRSVVSGLRGAAKDEMADLVEERGR